MITSETRSLMEIPQQYLLGEKIDAETEYKLGRACVAHCAAAIDYMHDPNESAYDALVGFVLEYGAGSGSEFYTDNKGWNSVAIADLLRAKGYGVVAQNLSAHMDKANFDKAISTGRVRTNDEKSLLNLYAAYAGEKRENWLTPIESTLSRGGHVISTITIPLLSGMGFGGHSIVITGLDVDTRRAAYFDPDHYNIQRYGQSPPEIKRISQESLHYERPLGDLLATMTGEIMHVIPRQISADR